MHAYSARFDDAVAFALAAFRPVFRKGTTIPYATHLLAVTALVGEHGGDEEQMMAAVLHDWLEDAEGASLAALEARFGERVARLVGALSDSVGHPKPPWKARKEAYLAHLRTEPAELKLISAADKLHNASCILRDHRREGDAVFARFNAGKGPVLWYYRELCVALADGWSHPILGELRDVVAKLHHESGEPYPG